MNLAGPAAQPGPRPRLWVFNLDAELELERGGGAYQSPLRVLRALTPLLAHAERLMAPGDECLHRLEETGGGRTVRDAPRAPRPPWLGAAWCPTPSALQRLARAGAELAPSPSVQVLRNVNHRRFALELGAGAPGTRYVSDESELESTLRERRDWLFKKPFGFAGRGQRRIALEPSKDDRRWLLDGLRLGGLVAEPWLELVREVAIHGLCTPGGELAIGHVCVQQTNAFRAWVDTRRAGPDDVTPAEVTRLREQARAVAVALTGAGYFGPFGIDAYYFRNASGGVALNPFGELNARYSMGFPVGDPRFDDASES